MVSQEGPAGARGRLGRTGYQVSRLGFGTVELGMGYGLPTAEGLPRPPADEEAVALLHASFAAGVDFVDTAPGYGRAEQLVGRALATWRGAPPIVATKVACPDEALLAAPRALAAQVSRSVDESRRRLGRARIDLLQVHNATSEALRSPALADALQACVADGRVAWLGASTYGAEAATAALETGWCATLQLAYNILDQQPAEEIIREAARRDVGVIARSVLLKGVLGAPAGELPPSLLALTPARERIQALALQQGESLAALCLRFVLSLPDVSTAILGIDRRAFLDEDLGAWRRGPLSSAARAPLRELHLGGDDTDPRTWGF